MTSTPRRIASRIADGRLHFADGEIPADPMFARLARTVADHRLPLQPMRDLLSAFSQDVGTTRYTTYQELCGYCARSANPVGLLMLKLYGEDGARNERDSDAICTALQLINFWQDVAVDWRKARIYIPLEDLARDRNGKHLDRASLGLAGVQGFVQFQLASCDGSFHRRARRASPAARGARQR